MSSSDTVPPTPSLPHIGGRGPVAPANAQGASHEVPPSPPAGKGWDGGASTRRSFLLLPLALAACGFTPAYAPGGAATKLMGSVRAADPTNKPGFDFVERIEERLGRTEVRRFDLAYSIATESVGVGITTDNRITRYNLKGAIEYTLTDAASGARITGGRVQSFTSYAATGSTVAGLAAEEDAAYRLMRLLADQIVARLIAEAAKLP
jgi:LPS-assembly lipoprotein